MNELHNNVLTFYTRMGNMPHATCTIPLCSRGPSPNERLVHILGRNKCSIVNSSFDHDNEVIQAVEQK